MSPDLQKALLEFLAELTGLVRDARREIEAERVARIKQAKRG